LTTRRLLAGWLAVTLGISPVLAQDALGTISGRAVDEARQPYANFSVQLRDVANGQVVQTVPLTAQGLFSAGQLTLAKRYLVELVDLRARKVVCSEGPYLLSGPDAITRNDVNIDCGASPAALWLILAGAGTATAIAVTEASPSR
jgi:hypothetical protein